MRVEGVHAAPEGVGIFLKLCNGLLPAGMLRLCGSIFQRGLRRFRLCGSILRRLRLIGLDLLHRRCRVSGIVLPKRHALLKLRRGQAEDGGQAAGYGKVRRLAAASSPPFAAQ